MNNPRERKTKESNDEKRDQKIKKILRESKTPQNTAYKIMKCYHEPGYGTWVSDESAEIMERLANNRLCAAEFSGKECAFATKELASLVLAWYALWNEYIFFDIRDRLYTVSKNEWCKSMFDKVLNTNRYDEGGENLYIEATILGNNEIPVCSNNLGLPDSLSEGAHSIRYSRK